MKNRDGIWYSDFYLSNGKRVRKSLDTRERGKAKELEKSLQIRLEAELKGMVKPAPAEPQQGAHKAAPSGTQTITLKEAYRRARTEHEKWRASTSPKTLDFTFKAVSDYFGDLKQLHEITDESVMEWSEKMRQEGLSASTINHRLSMVSVLFKCSRRWPECKALVKRPEIVRQTVRNGRVRILSYSEEARVISWFEENYHQSGFYQVMADLVPFLVDTGFRLSEALELRIDEVLWETGMVPAWKNKADVPRLVPMTKRVRAILEKRKSIPQPFGALTIFSAAVCWSEMREAIGINREQDPEFVLHALRHTCASRLASNGMDAFRIQKWMGHKRIETTLIYVTLFAPDLKALADTLDEGLAKAAKERPKGVPKTVPKRDRAVVDTARRSRLKVPSLRASAGVSNRELVRLSTHNPLVQGSSPCGPTKKSQEGRGLQRWRPFSFQYRIAMEPVPTAWRTSRATAQKGLLHRKAVKESIAACAL